MPRARPRRGWTVPAAAALLLVCAVAGSVEVGAAAEAPRRVSTPAPLTVLSRHVVSGTPSLATDIRWATERSVYLSRALHGVEVVALSPGGKSRTLQAGLLPDRRALRREIGFRAGFGRLAVSGETVLAAGSLANIAWGRFDREGGSLDGLQGWLGQVNDDVDLHGSTMVLLGSPHQEIPHEEQTGILWLGSLERELEDLRPILHDVRGAGAPSLTNCQLLELGAVRFREDGAFYVAPGYQPGLHLFSGKGKLRGTWDTRPLDLNVDCGTVDRKKLGLALPGPRVVFLSQEGRRTIDELLVLPQGPGLVVRTWSEGNARWELYVFTALGVSRHPLPLTSARAFDHLRGDVRDGKIVLLRSARNTGGETAETEIVVLEAPRG